METDRRRGVRHRGTRRDGVRGRRGEERRDLVVAARGGHGDVGVWGGIPFIDSTGVGEACVSAKTFNPQRREASLDRTQYAAMCVIINHGSDPGSEDGSSRL